MALEREFKSAQAYWDQRRAVARLCYDALGDIPDVGDPAPAAMGIPGAASWYVADRLLDPDEFSMVTVTARLPGKDWTWVGLEPIRHTSELYSFAGTPSLSFEDWEEGDELDDGSFMAVSPEWLDTVSRMGMLGKVDGTWPSGFAAGGFADDLALYRVYSIRLEEEAWRDPVTGTLHLYLRHFATLWRCPTANGGVKQLHWNTTTTYEAF